MEGGLIILSGLVEAQILVSAEYELGPCILIALYLKLYVVPGTMGRAGLDVSDVEIFL